MNRPTRRQEIGQDLAARICSGEFAVGDMLPSMAMLAADYRCSSQTVHSAIQDLEAQGIVRSRRSHGVRVTAPPEEATRNVRLLAVFPNWAIDDETSFASCFARGVTVAATEAGAGVELRPTRNQGQLDDLFATWPTGQFQGVVWSYYCCRELAVRLEERGIPQASVELPRAKVSIPCAAGNWEQALRDMVDMLKRRGVQKLGVFQHNDTEYFRAQYFDYFDQLRADAGLGGNEMKFHVPRVGDDEKAALIRHFLPAAREADAWYFSAPPILREVTAVCEAEGVAPTDEHLIVSTGSGTSALAPAHIILRCNITEMARRATQQVLDWITTGEKPESCTVDLAIEERG